MRCITIFVLFDDVLRDHSSDSSTRQTEFSEREAANIHVLTVCVSTLLKAAKFFLLSLMSPGHFFYMTAPQGVPPGSTIHVQVPGRGIVPVEIPKGNVKQFIVTLPDRQTFGADPYTRKRRGGDSYGWLFPLEKIFSALCLQK